MKILVEAREVLSTTKIIWWGGVFARTRKTAEWNGRKSQAFKTRWNFMLTPMLDHGRNTILEACKMNSLITQKRKLEILLKEERNRGTLEARSLQNWFGEWRLTYHGRVSNMGCRIFLKGRLSWVLFKMIGPYYGALTLWKNLPYRIRAMSPYR